MKRFKLVAILVLSLSMVATFVESTHAQRRKSRVVVKHVRVRHRVVVKKAHIRYNHLPRWGAVVATTPATSLVIKTHTNPYYFHNGVYYTAGNGGYVVVRPVRGVRVKVLPVGYRRIFVGPRPYYYYYGTFYTTTNDGYATVDPPVGAVIDALPAGYDVKTINDEEFYFLDGVQYAEVDAPEFDDSIGYEVIDVK